MQIAVVHTIVYKEQESSVSQISLMTEGWRNVGDAESTWYSCALGEGGSPGSALGSASRRKRILSALRCWRDHRGIVHADVVRVFSEGHYKFSRRRLALGPRRHPPSLWILNRRHLTVRRGAHHGAHCRPASSVLGLDAQKKKKNRDKHGSSRDLFSNPASG